MHGMIAGTTGSGKSELLMTLVAGLAVRYDPRIINFVLVDFKGGAAFEPFRKLPHVVDILTNVQASAVERMFVAIQAVMEERAALLARSGAKDLVEYRRKVAPRLGPDDPLPEDLPAPVHHRRRVRRDDRGQSGLPGAVREHHAPGPRLRRVAAARQPNARPVWSRIKCAPT